MRNWFSHALLLGILGTGALSTLTGTAQQQRMPATGQADLSLTYTTSHSNFIPGDGFWMQGGDVEMAFHFPARFAAVASVSGGHTGAGSGGVPLNLITSVYGLRYTWTLPTKTRDVEIFGQGLTGISQGFGSTFPAAGGSTTSATGLAIQAGGGVDIGLSPHWAVRAGEVQWLRSEIPNATTNVQNSLKIGAGILFRFQVIK